MTESSPDAHEFLDEDEWQSISAVLLLSRLVLADLDAALRQHHRLAVTEFDVLITLFNAPERRLGMSALSQEVMLSPAGMTHLITRLERDGLVRRVADASDGRKSYAVLTDPGASVLQAARRTHNDVLRRGLFAVTTPPERRALQRIWKRLSNARQPHDGLGPGQDS